METGTTTDRRSQAHAWLIVAVTMLVLAGWFVGALTSNMPLIVVTIMLAAGLGLYEVIVSQQRRT